MLKLQLLMFEQAEVGCSPFAGIDMQHARHAADCCMAGRPWLHLASLQSWWLAGDT